MATLLQLAAGGAVVALCPAPVLIGSSAVFVAAKGVGALRSRNKKETALRTKSESAGALDKKLESEVPATELAWQDLRMSLTAKDGSTKQILKGVSGVARPGRLLALMGPSGSGKTSLLTALAGRVPASSRMALTGAIGVNGVPAAESGHRQAFVQQEDIFYSMLTVQETLTMAAEMRLPGSTTPEARQAYVAHLMAVLGLSKVAGTRVGDEKNRGLSGGEKKRLSIGCELVGSPSLLFCDEPTTGLDSFQAEKVMSTLKSLAQGGHTVVASIHQPRSSIFAMFDDLILLSEGRPVYSGPADKALAHFASLGHPCPEHYNPAEFLADLISLDFASPEAETASRERLEKLVAAWERVSAQQAVGAGAVAASPRPRGSTSGARPAADGGVRVGPFKLLKLLFTRSWRQVSRDRATNVARAMSNLSSAVIFGMIFFRMGRKQSSIQDRMGLLQVAAINTAMSSLIKTLTIFPTERTIVSRERGTQKYGILPYLSAKLAAELPVGALFPLLFGAVVYPVCGLHPSMGRFAKFLGILTLEAFAGQALGLSVGSFAPSTEAALAIGPAVMLVWIVFGGYYANAENVPVIFRWLPRASLIKQSFEGLCVNEFPGLEFEADSNGGGMRDGKQVLKWLSFDSSTITGRCASQARILMFYYWATYCILRANQPRYLAVKPAEPDSKPQGQGQGQQPPAAKGAEAKAQPQAAAA